MPFKALAFSAQQYLQSRTGHPFRRSHIYELLAAAFGLRSHAAMTSLGFLTDTGIGPSHPTITPTLLERLAQLGYPSAISLSAAQGLTELATAQQMGFIRLEQLQQIAVLDSEPTDTEDDDWDDWEDEEDEEPNDSVVPAAIEPLPSLRQLQESPLLIALLEQAAESGRPEVHFILAALHRCKRPNSYLYDEACKGRALNSVERNWVEAYPAEKTRFDRYAKHLHYAATHGIRQAALEYAEAFNDSRFYQLAEQETGDVDVWGMIKAAPTEQDRQHWLRIAAEQGFWRALEELAYGYGSGESSIWALRQMAETGDLQAIRELAQIALDSKDLQQAWLWQHLALLLNEDLTHSTMRAYHDGGLYAGQEYDDDCGGPMYFDGDIGLHLPALDPETDHRIQEQAVHLFQALRSTG